jgi:HEAT repeat protein
VRKLAAFVLGEIRGTPPPVTTALCQAATDPAPSVRINAVEALRALMPFLKSSRWCPHTSPSSIY